MSLLAGRLLRAAPAPTASAAGNPIRPVFSSTRRYVVEASPTPVGGATVTFPGEGPGISYGLNWALAGRGVLVKDRVFHNLKASELQKHGAKAGGNLSAFPIHVRGNAVNGASEISKAQFGMLLKQVTTHISSVSNIFVQDGAICASSKCDAKVRVISDDASAAFSLSNLMWKTTARAVSHDSSPLTVYIATSVSPSTGEILGLTSQTSNGFLAVDIGRSSLIVCGKAFADAHGVKDALSAIAAPVISARGGLPVSARSLGFGGSSILFFASEDTIKRCTDLHENLISADAGVVLSSHGVAPFFQTGDAGSPNIFRKPSSVILASADSSGALPSVAKLSPSQAAYHFLAGYQDGKFVPSYSSSPSPINPLDLAKAFLSHLKDSRIPSFLINVNNGGKHISGKDLVKLVKSTLSGDTPESGLGTSLDPKGEKGWILHLFLRVRRNLLIPKFSRLACSRRSKREVQKFSIW